MKILGIHPAFYAYIHDPNIAIFDGDRVTFALEEERINRFKGSQGLFPEYSLKKLLDHVNMQINDFDMIAIDGVTSATLAAKTKRFILQQYQLEVEIQTFPHYLSHAYAAYFGSGFDESLIVTIDGVGDNKSISISIAKNQDIKLLFSSPWPGSLGGFYTAFTNYLGFHSAEGEYKVMGMAAYGSPKYNLSKYLSLKNKNLEVESSIDFWDNFKHTQVNEPNCNYEEIYAHTQVKPVPHSKLELKQEHYDLASSVQSKFTDIYCKLILAWLQKTEAKNICLSGGCALNCLANMSLGEQIPKKVGLYIQPAASDRGLAIGTCYQAANSKKVAIKRQRQDLYLGLSYELDIIKCSIERSGLNYKEYDTKNLIQYVAKLLINGAVIAWFQGRSENGPRALGNRSILALPTIKNIKDILNSKIKFREKYRPFAPSLTKEVADTFCPENIDYSTMCVTARIPKRLHKYFGDTVHADGTARIQVVDKDMNRIYYNLLKEIEGKTGCGILINTSLNLSGEPIVENPNDAIRTFVASGIDYLVLSNYILSKK